MDFDLSKLIVECPSGMEVKRFASMADLDAAYERGDFDKKLSQFRKGDVVVCTCEDHQTHGALGEVVGAGEFTDSTKVRFGYMPSEQFTCANDRLEVIDNLNDEEVKMNDNGCPDCPIPLRLRKGDIVMWVNGESDEDYVGELGEVLETPTGGSVFAYTKFEYINREVCPADVEVIDHIDDEESKFKIDDRVEYTGDETPAFKGRTGTVLEVWPNGGNLQVVWDTGMKASLKPKNVTLINDPATAPQPEQSIIESHLKSAMAFFKQEPYLLAIDVSASMLREEILNLLTPDFISMINFNKCRRIFTFDVGIRKSFARAEELKPYLKDASYIFERETHISCVCDAAEEAGLKNILMISDGSFDESAIADYKVAVITPERKLITYPADYTPDAVQPVTSKFILGDFPKAELRYATEAMLKAKAEDALKDVQHQADLDAMGITEHHISGTQRLLRLSFGFCKATIVCQHCNTVLKEIRLDE